MAKDKTVLTPVHALSRKLKDLLVGNGALILALAFGLIVKDMDEEARESYALVGFVIIFLAVYVFVLAFKAERLTKDYIKSLEGEVLPDKLEMIRKGFFSATSLYLLFMIFGLADDNLIMVTFMAVILMIVALVYNSAIDKIVKAEQPNSL